MSANKYVYKRNLRTTNLPDYFKSRIGLEEEEHTTVGLFKNLASYIAQLNKMQRSIDGIVSHTSGVINQPMISYDIVFLDGSVTSYKQTVKFKTFVNLTKGSYKHAYKILV